MKKFKNKENTTFYFSLKIMKIDHPLNFIFDLFMHFHALFFVVTVKVSQNFLGQFFVSLFLDCFFYRKKLLKMFWIFD